MTKLLAGLACVACLAFGSGSAIAAADSDVSGSADAAFKALYTREWSWRQAQRTGDEDTPGPAGSRLPRVDAATQAAREKYWTSVLAELRKIPVDRLSVNEQDNYRVYEYQIRTLLDDQRFREWQMPFNADTAFWTNLGYAARGHFGSVGEYRNYLSRLRDIPRYFADEVANMRLGLARGFSQPPLVVKGIEPSLTSVIDAKGEGNLFYTPFKDMPSAVPADQQAALRTEALRVIQSEVIPAYAKLLDFMRHTYLKQARTTLAAYDLPDGKAYYQSRIYNFTTLDLTPEQIHRIGLDEMADIHQQMLDTIRRAGFKGGYGEFLQFLRSDPQFWAKTPKQLLEYTAWIAKQIDGRIGNYIGRMPRARFGIIPVPDDLAPFYTGGRGGPGVCMFNTWNLPVRKLYSMPALVLHECEPGHSTQMPLAAELEGLPDFRRYSYISAYGEGWALYGEYLGVEMGMYQTPYDHFGYLSYQAWRAARLVVDTGLHAMHWTRQQAVDYMRENTALADHEIQTEVNRYIAWPGQALAYYLGERDIRQQRARAEKALGDKFDLRAFHDAVLSTGSVPLPVLNARIDRFIADGGKSPWAKH